MKNWKWALITVGIFVLVFAAGAVLLIMDMRSDLKYASLEEIQEDIALYHAEILDEVCFEDYVVFFIAEPDGPQPPGIEAQGEDVGFYFRLFEKKRDGTFFQRHHSFMVPKGSVGTVEWSTFWNKSYLVRFSVHEEGTEPLGAEDGNWKYACEGDKNEWHFSYEILTKEEAGDYVPVEYTQKDNF